MKRISTALLCLAMATPAFAQKAGFCETSCSFVGTSDGSVNHLKFTCGFEKVGDHLTKQRYPAALAKKPGQLASRISAKNHDFGINVNKPTTPRIFYPCGLP